MLAERAARGNEGGPKSRLLLLAPEGDCKRGAIADWGLQIADCRLMRKSSLNLQFAMINSQLAIAGRMVTQPRSGVQAAVINPRRIAGRRLAGVFLVRLAARPV